MRTTNSLCLIMVLLMAGCSGKVPLTGKVTFEDGSPVTFGTVFFLTPTTMSQAGIQKDGTYTVGSDSVSDGMPKGEYQVYLAVEEVTSKVVRGETMTSYVSQIDPIYTNAETSGLKFVADGKTRRFDIQVKRAK